MYEVELAGSNQSFHIYVITKTKTIKQLQMLLRKT